MECSAGKVCAAVGCAVGQRIRIDRVDDAVLHRDDSILRYAQRAGNAALDRQSKLQSLDDQAGLRGRDRIKIRGEGPARHQRAMSKAQAGESCRHAQTVAGDQQAVESNLAVRAAIQHAFGSEQQCRSDLVRGSQLDAGIGGNIERQQLLIATAVGDLDDALAAQVIQRLLNRRPVIRNAQQLGGTASSMVSPRSYSPPPSSAGKP